MFALNPLSCLESRKTAYCLLALFLWLSASGPCTTNLSLHEVSYQGTDQPELVGLGKCPAPPCLLLYPPTESDSPFLLSRPPDTGYWTGDHQTWGYPLWECLWQKTVLERLPSCGTLDTPLAFSEANRSACKGAWYWHFPHAGAWSEVDMVRMRGKGWRPPDMWWLTLLQWLFVNWSLGGLITLEMVAMICCPFVIKSASLCHPPKFIQTQGKSLACT